MFWNRVKVFKSIVLCGLVSASTVYGSESSSQKEGQTSRLKPPPIKVTFNNNISFSPFELTPYSSDSDIENEFLPPTSSTTGNEFLPPTSSTTGKGFFRSACTSQRRNIEEIVKEVNRHKFLIEKLLESVISLQDQLRYVNKLYEQLKNVNMQKEPLTKTGCSNITAEGNLNFTPITNKKENLFSFEDLKKFLFLFTAIITSLYLLKVLENITTKKSSVKKNR